MQSDGLHSALSPVVYGDIVLSIKNTHNTRQHLIVKQSGHKQGHIYFFKMCPTFLTQHLDLYNLKISYPNPEIRVG